jgi:hypothetical protein
MVTRTQTMKALGTRVTTHHITCDIDSIEYRACQLSKMILLDVSGGGTIYEYTDIGLGWIYRSYTKMITLLTTH